MQFPNITKGQGFWISIPFIAIYCLVFYLYNIWKLDQTPTLDMWSTRIFLVGAILHMMLYLRDGGWLTYGSKRTNTFWSDGVCFAPNFLHFTVQAFNFACFWGIQTDDVDTRQQNNVDVVVSPFLASTKHNVSMSHTASVIDRSITAFLVWLLVGWKKGEGHLTMMRFGFRLMLVGYALATASALWNHGAKEVSKFTAQGNSAVNAAVHESINTLSGALGVTPPVSQQDTKVAVFVQLDIGTQPIIPNEEDFTPAPDDEAIYYVMIDGDSRKYFLYPHTRGTEVAVLKIEKNSCAIIPAGKNLVLDSASPPVYALNMESPVWYRKKDGALSFLEKIELKVLRSSSIYVTDNSWHFVNNNWHTVQTLSATALQKTSLNKGSHGGVVCF